VIRARRHLVLRVKKLNERVFVAFSDLNQVCVVGYHPQTDDGGVRAMDRQSAVGDLVPRELAGAGNICRERGCRPARKDYHSHEAAAGRAKHAPLGCSAFAAYTALMIGVDDHAAP